MALPDLDAQVRRWFAEHTHPAAVHDVGELVELKRGRRVSVVLPARDEAGTVGAIVRTVRERLVAPGLVDEVIVVDSRSSDTTVQVATDAGADVVTTLEATPGTDDGKGGALRTGVRAMTGDLGVFLDADVRDFDADFVTGLLAPLLRDDALVLVKAFYDRPWGAGADATPGDGAPTATGGGRVTELVARPLIARRVPELAGFVQPLSGECAFVRSALAEQPFVSGYGVDLAMLAQTVRRHGLDAVAQADLGRRLHRHQDLGALGRMALQVGAALDIVLEDLPDVSTGRTVIGRDEAGRMRLCAETVTTRLLPPPG